MVRQIDLSQGEHVSKDGFDAIPDGQLGSSFSVPFVVAPPDFRENGVPYGAWCKCSICDSVFRSTIAFDCYAVNRNPGAPLKCEACRDG